MSPSSPVAVEKPPHSWCGLYGPDRQTELLKGYVSEDMPDGDARLQRYRDRPAKERGSAERWPSLLTRPDRRPLENQRRQTWAPILLKAKNVGVDRGPPGRRSETGGSDWPVDVTDHAVAAVEARGPKLAADAMLALAACDGWAALAAPYRAVLRTVLVDGASRPVRDAEAGRHCWIYPGIANATIGSTKMDGTGWRQPDPLAADDTDTAPWAPVSNVDASAAVWPAVASGLAFTGRLTLLSGKPKQGKSTTVGAAGAAAADGADWLTGEALRPALVR